MTKVAHAFIAFVFVLVIAGTASLFNAGTASAAGMSQAQCNQLDREYQQLLRKQENGTLTPADRKRMKQIDDQTSIYCS